MITLLRIFFEWIGSLPTELSAALGDAGARWGVVVALLACGALTLIGTLVLRRVGWLNEDSPPIEVFAFGLTAGLITVTTLWAAVESRGTSTFVPVAIAVVVALILGGGHKRRGADRTRSSTWLRIGAVSVAFLLGAGLLFGSTIAPSARDGVAPAANLDVAYYTSLQVGLAKTGSEGQWFASGFDHIAAPHQRDWYHWGEVWLAEMFTQVLGVSPMVARHYVVLPLLLLALGSLGGVVTRRLANGAPHSLAYGVAAVLLLAPVPITPIESYGGPPPLLFHITTNGIGAVVILFVTGLLLRLQDRPRAPGGLLFGGAMVAAILPMNVVLAPLALAAGSASAIVWALRFWLKDRSLPSVSREWKRTLAIAAALTIATIAWGLITDHGFKDLAANFTPSPFGYFWFAVVTQTIIAGFLLFAVPAVWFLRRKESGPVPPLLFGSMVAVVAGAFVWGLRGGNFYNLSHLFLAAISVFLVPVAGVAIWSLRNRLNQRGHRVVSGFVLVALVMQLAAGILLSVLHMYGQRLAGYDYPLAIVQAIESRLPEDARIAYSCKGSEPREVDFYLPTLAGLDAMTGRRVVPMCRIPDDPYFQLAPQGPLFEPPGTRPSPEEVVEFLNAQGIQYLYEDSSHVNDLLPAEQLQLISQSGSARLYRVTNT